MAVRSPTVFGEHKWKLSSIQIQFRSKLAIIVFKCICVMVLGGMLGGYQKDLFGQALKLDDVQ
jgi:hypothetical protein